MSKVIKARNSNGRIWIMYLDPNGRHGVAYEFPNERATKRNGGNAMAMSMSKDEFIPFVEKAGYKLI